MLTKKKPRDKELRADLLALVKQCRREVQVLSARIRAGKTGYRSQGRREALGRCAQWIETLANGPWGAMDLATNVHDAVMCLQQNADDEEMEATTPCQRHSCVQQRLRRQAREKASAYLEIKRALVRLLQRHYPGSVFPLTLIAGHISYHEWRYVDGVMSNHRCRIFVRG